MRNDRSCLICVAIFALSCGPGYPVIGKSQHYEFAYDDPTFDDPYSLPPIVEGGAHAVIEVTARDSGCDSEHPFTHVASSDPSVATFVFNGSTVEVTTGNAGTAELQLLDDRGKLVDSVDVIVDRVARLEPSRGMATVLVGGTYDLSVSMYGAGNAPLGAQRGMLSYEATGAVSVTHTDAFAQTDLHVTANTLGDGNISLAAPQIVDAFAVNVVGADEITAIEINRPWTQDTDYRWTVTTVASAVSPVFGATCAWQVSDPAVEVQSQYQSHNLEGEPVELTGFRLTKPGSYTASCSIGSARLDIRLSR